MLREVEVRTAVDTFHFLEAERHLEFDIGSRVCIVRQLLVVVIAVFVVAQAHGLVPLQARFLPLLEPTHLLARTNEELHLHLLELTHTEDELASYNLVAERLTYLCDTERHLHAPGLLHIQEVHEDTLCSLGTEIDLHRAVGRRAHLGREHEVELPHVGPVACPGYRADDFTVEDELPQVLEVRVVHVLLVAFVDFVPLGLMLEDTGVRLAELRLVEGVAELLRSLRHFLVYLFLYLRQMIFDQDIGTIAFLRVFVVYQRVVEGIHVSRRFPDGRVHEDGRVDAHHILMQQGHAVPPVFLDIVLQLHTVLSVVIDCAQPVVNLRRGEYETILLTV